MKSQIVSMLRNFRSWLADDEPHPLLREQYNLTDPFQTMQYISRFAFYRGLDDVDETNWKIANEVMTAEHLPFSQMTDPDKECNDRVPELAFMLDVLLDPSVKQTRSEV